MGKRILVAVDGSEPAFRASKFVIDNFPDAELVLLHVIDPSDAGYSAQASIPSFSEEWYEQEKEKSSELLNAIASEAIDEGLLVKTEIVAGRPSKTIVHYAEEHGIDHIVLGSHGREGVSRLLLGSVAESVMRRADMPVTVTH